VFGYRVSWLFLAAGSAIAAVLLVGVIRAERPTDTRTLMVD